MLRGLALWVALLLPPAAAAHDPGLSSASVRLRGGAIEVELAIPWADAGSSPDLAPAQAFRLRLGGRLLSPQRVETRRRPGDRIELRLRFSRLDRLPLVLELESRLLDALPFGHKQLVRVLAEDGSVLASAVLSAYAPSLRVELP